MNFKHQFITLVYIDDDYNTTDVSEYDSINTSDSDSVQEDETQEVYEDSVQIQLDKM